MIENIDKFLKLAEKGTDYAQIYVENTAEESLTINNNNIDSYDCSVSNSCYVKVYKDGKEGCVFGNALNKELIEKAIKLAKINSKKDYFYGLPEQSRHPKIVMFDKKILALTPEEIVSLGEEMINTVSCKNVTLTQGGISKTLGKCHMVNSNGVEAQDQFTAFDAMAAAVARKGNIVSSYYDGDDMTRFFKIDKVCESVREKTLEFLKPRTMSRLNGKQMVLTPNAFASLLDYAFLSNLNGKNVEKGKSIFADKLGESVISSKLSIYDDGKLDWGTESFPFDAEGTPAQKTPLILKGVLKNFIYDFNTGKHNGKRTTGNATIDGIDFSNIVFESPESFKSEQLDNAVIIDSLIGVHTANSLTTDFSVKAEHLYSVKNGNIVPLQGVMFSGNFAKLLANVLAMSKDIVQKEGVLTGDILIKAGVANLVNE